MRNNKRNISFPKQFIYMIYDDLEYKLDAVAGKLINKIILTYLLFKNMPKEKQKTNSNNNCK